MLEKLQGNNKECIDMAATNFRYHRGCLTSYMLKRNHIASNFESLDSESSNEQNAAFESIMSDIEHKLLNENTIYFLCQLRDKVRSLLADKNVDNPHLYSSKKLIRQLEKHFGTIEIEEADTRLFAHIAFSVYHQECN